MFRTHAALTRLRIAGIAGISGGLIVLTAACGSSSSTPPTTSSGTGPSAAASAGATADAATTSYVANVCKAAVQLDTAVRSSRAPGAGASGTPVPGSGSTASGTPAPAATRAAELKTAATAFVTALQAANPPAGLQAYNASLVDAVNQAITNVENGAFGRPGANGAARTPRSGTPFARRSGTAPAGAGGRGRGGPGAGIFLRNIPTPPAAASSALKQAADQNSDCQSSGFTFGLG